MLLGPHNTFIVSLHFQIFIVLISLFREYFTNVIKMIFPNPVKQGTITVFIGKWETEARLRLNDLLTGIKTLVAELGKNPNAFTLTQVPEGWQAHTYQGGKGSYTWSAQCRTAAKSDPSVPGYVVLCWTVDPRTPPQPAASIYPSIYPSVYT